MGFYYCYVYKVRKIKIFFLKLRVTIAISIRAFKDPPPPTAGRLPGKVGEIHSRKSQAARKRASQLCVSE